MLLQLEITEAALMRKKKRARKVLRWVSSAGSVRTADSMISVPAIRRFSIPPLPIDTMKIDQSFVRDIETDPNDAAIVDAVVGDGAPS